MKLRTATELHCNCGTCWNLELKSDSSLYPIEIPILECFHYAIELWSNEDIESSEPGALSPGNTVCEEWKPKSYKLQK